MVFLKQIYFPFQVGSYFFGLNYKHAQLGIWLFNQRMVLYLNLGGSNKTDRTWDLAPVQPSGNLNSLTILNFKNLNFIDSKFRYSYY